MYDYIIAGLGNPGEKYARTRHNIGWMVANSIALEHKQKWKNINNLFLQSEIKYAGKNILLVMPLTFMNLSGNAIKYLADKLKISPEKIIIIVDEYNFPVGKIHIKKCGSDGGHNGVASVIEELGSNDFLKIRCGIGKDFPPGGMVDYVLSDFPEEQIDDVIKMIDKTIDAIEHLIKAGFKRAMSDINSERLWVAKTEKKEEKKDVRNDS